MTRKHVICFMSIWMFVLLAGWGCSGTTDPDIPPGTLEPNLNSIQIRIFTPRCATSGCHNSNSRVEGLDLSPGRSGAALINVESRQGGGMALVTPGDAEQSYLLKKLEGSQGMLKERMPLRSTPLSPEEIEIIRSWINGGAQEN